MSDYFSTMSKAYLTLRAHYSRFGVEPMSFEEFVEMGAKIRDPNSNNVVLVDKNGKEMWIGVNGSIFFPGADGVTSVMWGPLEVCKIVEDNLNE